MLWFVCDMINLWFNIFNLFCLVSTGSWVWKFVFSGFILFVSLSVLLNGYTFISLTQQWLPTTRVTTVDSKVTRGESDFESVIGKHNHYNPQLPR